MQRIMIYMWLSLVALLGLLLYWWTDRYQDARQQLQRELQLSVDQHLANEVLDIFQVTIDSTRDDTSYRFPKRLEADSLKMDLQIVVFEDTLATDSSFFSRPHQPEHDLVIQTDRFPDWSSPSERPLTRWLASRDTSLRAHLDSVREALSITISEHANDRPSRKGDMLITVRTETRFNDAKLLRIGQYRWRLLAGLWPELLAGSLLLLLTGLAFWQSWRTMAQQSRLVEDRDALIANLAHELKTPIATVGVALEALENFGAETDPKRRKDYLRLSRAELQRLDRLADQSLLSLALQDKNALQNVRVEPLDLRESILKSWELLQVRNALSADQLLLSDETLPRAIANAEQLDMVIDNLLTNAVKYGGADLLITVSCWQENKQIYLRIADNGPGIPASESERIFERFYRIKDQFGHRQKGHGLGLSLSRDLMRSMKGQLYLDTSYHKGAAFVLNLPADV